MALPTRAFRGDIVVMVNWAGTGTTYTNFCGATGGTLTVSNEIRSEQVGDCDDWSAPIQTLKKPGAQNWTMSIDGTWAAQNNRQVIDWAVNQTLLPVRVHFVNAVTGQYEYFDGDAYLSGLDISGIGNITGDAVTRSIQIEFDGTPELTLAT